MKYACAYCGRVYENDGKKPHNTVKYGTCGSCPDSGDDIPQEPENDWRSSLGKEKSE